MITTEEGTMAVKRLTDIDDVLDLWNDCKHIIARLDNEIREAHKELDRMRCNDLT